MYFTCRCVWLFSFEASCFQSYLYGVYFVSYAKFCDIFFSFSLGVPFSRRKRQQHSVCLWLTAHYRMFEEAASSVNGCFCVSLLLFRSPTCQSLSRASACSGGQPCEIPLLCKGQPSRHALQVRSISAVHNKHKTSQNLGKGGKKSLTMNFR